jgi:hypothetical protein
VTSRDRASSSARSIRYAVVPSSSASAISDACTTVAVSFVFAETKFVRSEPGALAKLLAIPFFFLAGVAVTAARISSERAGRQDSATILWTDARSFHCVSPVTISSESAQWHRVLPELLSSLYLSP